MTPHEDVLLPATLTFLKNLDIDILPKSTYLGGGTAIALQLGHRRSIDLDFFTKTNFPESSTEKRLSNTLGFKTLMADWQTLVGTIGKVKFSLFGYKHKQIAPFEKFYQVPLASLPDLAAMKLDTVVARGTKRDFLDIYYLAQKFSLPELFGFYEKKYNNLEEKWLLLSKALVYFADADKDEMPHMLALTDWKKIKSWFISEVKMLV